jgi:tape measure domain-containing protein
MDELARLTIRVDASDGPKAVRNLDDVTKATKRAEDGAAKMASGIKSMLGGLAAALSVREVVNYADAATNLANRLRLVTEGEADRARVTRELFEVSRRTRSDVTATAELYVKLRQSNDDLKLSTTQTRDVTEAFALSLKASGADAGTSAAAIRQFAQAMARGTLAGDEFVTISEAAPEVLRLLQQDLGKSRAELLKMKEAGELTGGMIANVLIKNVDALRKSAAESTPEISDGFVALRNSIIKTIGASNDMATAAKNIATGLADTGKFIEDNGPILGQLVKFAALTWAGVKAVQALTASVAALNAASVASIAARLGPLVALLAPGTGFIAKGFRDASDRQDRAAEVARFAEMPAGLRDGVAAATVAQLTAIDKRRMEVERQFLENNSEELARERTRLNTLRNTLVETQVRLREAGAFGNAGPVETPGTPGAGGPPGSTPISKAAKEVASMLESLAEAGREITRGIEQRDAATALFADTYRQAGINSGVQRTGMPTVATGGAFDAALAAERATAGRAAEASEASMAASTRRAAATTQALADGLQRSIAAGIEGGFDAGAKSLDAFIRNLRGTLVRVLSEATANSITGALMGSGGGSGGGGGLGSLVSGIGKLFGGKGTAAAPGAATAPTGGGLGLSGALLGGFGLLAASQILPMFGAGGARRTYGDPNAGAWRPFEAPQDITSSAGTYNAPAGFNANAYRFEAGRPSGPVVTGNTIMVTLPEGTPREQVEQFLAELERLGRAQGLPPGTLPQSGRV